MISKRVRFSLSFVVVLFIVAGGLFAEAPVAVAAPRKARSVLVVAAEGFEGVPYRYGGSDRAGFDCSGLVYRVYLDAISVSVPRSARSLHVFAEPIERAKLQPGDLVFFNTDGPLAHVGIFAGDGRFIHAASEGPRTGVIESSLAEPYWSRAYAGAGRVIPSAEYLGLVLTAALGPELGAGPALRGLSASASVAYRVLGIELGLELRPEYDAALGVGRLPLVLSVALGKDLRVFAGPALTLGDPTLDGGGDARSYRAEGGALATAGLVWTPIRFRTAGNDVGLYGELVYDRYVPAAGSAGDAAADLAATVRLGMGLRLRWTF